MLRWIVPRLLAAVALVSLTGVAQAADTVVSGVEVVAASPLPGSEIPLDLVPSRVQTVGAADLSGREGPALLGAVEARLTGVSLDNAQDNPFQPSLTYRGFSASPLGGDAQGLAVYVDGSRFNQPFGDTADWDLIPDIAVSSITLEGPSPAFGLNALGGALAVRLKDGFSDPGGAAEVSAGSFGRWSAQAQAGGAKNGRSVFLAAALARDGGWRAQSPSDVRQAYADLGLRGERGELHLKLIGADTDLTGNGASPVELLAADRRAVFTYPDETHNKYLRASLSAQAVLGGGWSLTAAAYAARLNQHTLNGDASDIEGCDDGSGLLCLDDDLATDDNGDPIPDFLGGDGYGQLNGTRTRADAFGASIQLSSTAPRGRLDNHWVAGAAYDGGRTRFAADSLLGALTDDRGFEGPGIPIDQDDGSIAPVSVHARNDYAGFYAIDVLSLTSALAVNASARLNLARVRLADQIGTDLNGVHHYAKLNPGIGATWRFAPRVTAYASYAQTNRAPTPAELSCAGPDRPCSLTNFFVDDPHLKQVVARTGEIGLRGRRSLGGADLRWALDAYRTATRDDVLMTAAAVRGRAYFQNIGATRRQGIEADADLKTGRLTAHAAYSYTDARFRVPLVLTSEDNPRADADGLIHAAKGARMPGVPAHRLKLGLDYEVTPALTLGADAIASSGQVLFGDEANLTPKTGSYAVFNLDAAWRFTRRLEAFGGVSNLLGKDYETYGSFCPTGDVDIEEAPGASDARCLSPAPPRSFRAGLRARF